MSFLVANLPPINSYIRKEFLYDGEKGCGEYVPCIWISLKSLRGQAFRIEAYLPEYGALYDKLPLHAFVSRTTDLDTASFLPLDHLQLWNCFSHNIALIKKSFCIGLTAKMLGKNKNWYTGKYMFTADNACPDPNIFDTTYSEWPEDHKSFNFIQLDNGQYAAQPNNRMLILDPSSNPENLKFPDFKACTKNYSVEENAKWALGDTTTVMYQK